MRPKWLVPLPAVLANAVIVGAEIAWFSVQDGAAFWPAFGLNFVTVGLGEAGVCFVLGLPLLHWVSQNKALCRRAVKS